MIIAHFHNDLSWPNFLINQLIAIINTDNEIQRCSEYMRFVLGQVQNKEKGIFIVRI